MDLWNSDLQKVEYAKYCSWLQQLLVNHLSLHAFIGSFISSIIPYLQLDVCSHKIWCTHHLQMSLQLPGESISFTNISGRGREFQRSWQTMQFIQIFSGSCKNGSFVLTSMFVDIMLFSDTATSIDFASAGMGRVRASRHRTGFTRCWHHPQKRMASHDFSRQERAGGGMKERKRRVLKLHQDGRDEKKMPRYAESGHVSLMWPSSCEFSIAADSLCVFFLAGPRIVMRSWKQLKRIEKNRTSRSH